MPWVARVPLNEESRLWGCAFPISLLSVGQRVLYVRQLVRMSEEIVSRLGAVWPGVKIRHRTPETRRINFEFWLGGSPECGSNLPMVLRVLCGARPDTSSFVVLIPSDILNNCERRFPECVARAPKDQISQNFCCATSTWCVAARKSVHVRSPQRLAFDHAIFSKTPTRIPYSSDPRGHFFWGVMSSIIRGVPPLANILGGCSAPPCWIKSKFHRNVRT